MADSFRPLLDGLQRVTDGLIVASDGLLQANRAMKTVLDATLAAQEEHEDLRETVVRLESLVMELNRKLGDRPVS